MSRLFWGRGGLYKSSFHILVTISTSVFVLVGLWNRISAEEQKEQALSVNYGVSGNSDLLEQGGSLTTVLALDETQVNYTIKEHVIADGETLDSIAAAYGVSKDTIKWANSKLLSPYNDAIRVGWTLSIPEMNGVLYTVKSGDSIDTVVASVLNSNRFDVIELNGLIPPSYSLTPGQRIFVPNGALPAPAPLPPQPIYTYYPGTGGYVSSGVTATAPLGSFPAGAFDDALTHPRCANYSYSRGFLPWHNGVDLAKNGGCPIRAIAAGTVIFAGWSSWGGGYTVKIDHGDGVVSEYLHGDGNIWVRYGEYVAKGQDIMYMGSTGNSSGTHLHLTIKYNGTALDPAPYVPYRR